MAVLRMKDVRVLSVQERKKKISEIRLELVKAQVTANKTNAKTKELKRALARLLTVRNTKELTSDKEASTT